MISEQTRSKILEIVEEFKKAGYIELENRIPPDGEHCLYLPSKRRDFYFGTYLNPFSVLPDEKREPGDPYLWSDKTAHEMAEVSVYPVYRRNGTAEDVSVGISVTEWHYGVRPYPAEFERDVDRNGYGEIVRRESPFPYVDHPESLLSVCGSGRSVRVAKLRNTAGAKAVANAVKKAMAAVDAYVPLDHSAFEKDRKDYHPDTTAEYRRVQAKHRAETRG